MLCCLGLLIQSCLVLLLHRKVDHEEKDEDLEIAERDFNYQHAKLHGAAQRKSSIAYYAITSLSKMTSLTRDQVKKHTISSTVSPVRPEEEDEEELKKNLEKASERVVANLPITPEEGSGSETSFDRGAVIGKTGMENRDNGAEMKDIESCDSSEGIEMSGNISPRADGSSSTLNTTANTPARSAKKAWSSDFDNISSSPEGNTDLL